MKAYLTPQEAISLLPNNEFIHTFINNSFGLIGADWNKKDIVDKLNNDGMVIELTGEAAREMNHGMCVYSKLAKYHDEILFIETDKEKLLAYEKYAKFKMDGGEK